MAYAALDAHDLPFPFEAQRRHIGYALRPAEGNWLRNREHEWRANAAKQAFGSIQDGIGTVKPKEPPGRDVLLRCRTPAGNCVPISGKAPRFSVEL
jgi:hypothetical protein